MWRNIFDGYKIKGNKDTNEIAFFVFKNTHYKMFTTNGIVYWIDETNDETVTAKTIKYTEVGKLQEMV